MCPSTQGRLHRNVQSTQFLPHGTMVSTRRKDKPKSQRATPGSAPLQLLPHISRPIPSSRFKIALHDHSEILSVKAPDPRSTTRSGLFCIVARRAIACPQNPAASHDVSPTCQSRLDDIVSRRARACQRSQAGQWLFASRPLSSGTQIGPSVTG